MADQLAELDELANTIGAQGAAEDDAIGTLAKAVSELGSGFSSAMRDALAIIKMEKGKAAPTSEEDSDDDGESAEQEGADDDSGEGEAAGEDENSEDEGGAGFEDMQLGDYIDVTELMGDLFEMNKSLVATNANLETQNGEILAMVKGQAKEIKELRDLTVQVLTTQVATSAPMAKGVQDLISMLGNIPEGGVVSHRIIPSRRALERNGIKPNLQVQALSKAQMAKAMQASIIGEDSVRWYTKHGVLSPNDEENANLLAQIHAL